MLNCWHFNIYKQDKFQNYLKSVIFTAVKFAVNYIGMLLDTFAGSRWLYQYMRKRLKDFQDQEAAECLQDAR